MNINPNYQDSEKNNVELAEAAIDCLEVHIFSKALDKLEVIDIVGFATVKAFFQELAEKADAYEQLSDSESEFYRN